MIPVAITGLGLVSPAGVGVEAGWDAVCSGRTLVREDPALSGLEWGKSGRVPGFDPREHLGAKNAWRLDRFVQLAIVAAREAVASAGLDMTSWDPARVAIVLGNSLGGTGTLEEQVLAHGAAGPDSVSAMLMPKWMPNMLPGSIAIDLGVTGESVQVGSACASGTTAIGYARSLIANGTYDVVIAGASESAITPTITAGLAKMGALSQNSSAAEASRPFDDDRDGFVIAEAAGMLILESEGSRTSRGAPALAWVRGYGAATDAHHVTAPHPEGRGLAAAVRAAVTEAGIAPADIGYVNAHGTSTPMNDHMELAVLDELLAPGTAVSSTKGATGHALAAAGAIEAVFTVLSLRDGVAPGTVNLTNAPDSALDLRTGPAGPISTDFAMSVSAGFGGHNAAVVLQRGDAT